METRLAPAKINLFLRVVGKRSDNYHDIETFFQRIGLFDRLTFEKTPAGGAPIQLEVRGAGLAGTDPKDNLVFRAWEKLVSRCPDRIGPVRATLEKRIPVGGGLGGGSSDAAAALLGLRSLFDLPLADDALREIGAELGADVPFFLGPPAAIGRGIGDKLTPTPHGARFWAALAFPPFGISTAEVYRRYDPAASREKGDLEGLVRALKAGNLDRTLALAFNDLEPLALAVEPELGEIRERLEALAGRPVRMSGSGSTLFTLCATDEDARAVARKWERGAPCNTETAALE